MKDPAMLTMMEDIRNESITLRSVQINWLTAHHNTHMVTLFSKCARGLRLFLSEEVGSELEIDLSRLELLEIKLEAIWPLRFVNM